MFPFDAATLPKLTTRKALIVVDFQNDFDAAGSRASLPVTEPEGLITRTLALTEAFRTVGDVVWVQSCFDQPRPLDQESIVASDSTLPRASRRSRFKLPEVSTDMPAGPVDPEAFLSHREPTCVVSRSPGAEMPSIVRRAVRDGDIVLTKTHYSAFTDTPLLRLLRAKMIMEVFICGSLTNVGVYATALDAAGHGMAINIIEDCCGYRVEARQVKAIRNLVELTGCEVASSQEVLEGLQPKKISKNTKTSKKAETQGGGSHSNDSVPGQLTLSPGKDKTSPSRKSTRSPSLTRSMARIRLTSRSPEPMGITSIARNTMSHAEREQSRSDGEGERESDSNEDEPEEAGEEADEDSSSDSDGNRRQAKITDFSPKTSQKMSRTTPLETKIEDISSQQALEDNHSRVAAQDKTQNQRSSAATAKTEPSTESESDSDADSESNSDEDDDRPVVLCDGDTTVIPKILPRELEVGIFDKLRHEVQWQRMSHQGGEVPRLVAVQGAVSEEGSMPVYRHPSDESPPLLPFSPTVDAVRVQVEERLGHPVNHVLIQFYRDGNDYISEHSDKTLDIVKGSYIANVSLGAQRTMVFRTKRAARDPSLKSADGPPDGCRSGDAKRRVERVALPHNSLCKMGLATNMKWLHAIRQDRRADRDKVASELAYGGTRISLTFRRIGTFLSHDESVIWGQGATSNVRDGAQPVINGQGPEAIAMLRAFGSENHASVFDWNAHYGGGFDVLHIRSAPRFFASADAVVNLRIALMLAELGVDYAKGSMAVAANAAKSGTSSIHGGISGEGAASSALPIKFIDNDADRTSVQGGVAIMLYIDSRHGRAKAGSELASSNAKTADCYSRFQRALHFYDMVRHQRSCLGETFGQKEALGHAVKQELTAWDAIVEEGHREGFIAGSAPSIADFALWPVLYALVNDFGDATVFQGLQGLRRYYTTFATRASVKKVLGAAVEKKKST